MELSEFSLMINSLLMHVPNPVPTWQPTLLPTPFLHYAHSLPLFLPSPLSLLALSPPSLKGAQAARRLWHMPTGDLLLSCKPSSQELCLVHASHWMYLNTLYVDPWLHETGREVSTPSTIYIYTHVHTYTHPYLQAHIGTYTHLHMHAHTHTHAYTLNTEQATVQKWLKLYQGRKCRNAKIMQETAAKAKCPSK
jgi:hypothetical protein